MKTPNEIYNRQNDWFNKGFCPEFESKEWKIFKEGIQKLRAALGLIAHNGVKLDEGVVNCIPEKVAQEALEFWHGRKDGR